MIKKRVVEKITKRSKLSKIIYAIVIAFAIIAFWRGVWGLMDLYLFPNNYALSLSVSVFIGLAILFFTKHIFDELI